MKPITFLMITACILVSCSGDGSGSRKVSADDEFKISASDYSSAYFSNRLGNARVFTDEEDGLLTITNDAAGYKINQEKIIAGLIDDDSKEDAIVPFYAMRGKSIMGYYHMILLASADTFVVAKTVSDIFSVHDIRNRKIIAEVSTVSPDSPGFGCDECREVVRYRWNNGNLENEE
ncbi:MAG: hypothetical protein JXR67_06750 [Bacteroidales bacterium]|nr:hypothetical protein [Bacteroidales bacterium]